LVASNTVKAQLCLNTWGDTRLAVKDGQQDRVIHIRNDKLKHLLTGFRDIDSVRIFAQSTRYETRNFPFAFN
jgi:hypothetical protein